MTTDERNDDGGQVLRFPHRIGHAEVVGSPPKPAGDDNGADDNSDVDRESITDEPLALGNPVDPPDEPSGLGARRRQRRQPIVPKWLRSKKDAITAAKWTLNQAGYVTAFHGLRIPKYAGKVAVYAPVGLLRSVGRLVRWAAAEDGNYALRQAAANNDDAATWLRLDMQRQRETRWRWFLVALAVVAIIPVVAAVAPAVPTICWWLAAPVAAVLLAWAGRPADRPITDRVTEARAYRKLTAELDD